METNKVTSNEDVPRKRNRQATQALILDALSRVIVRDGYTNIGINAIAREANVDKVLIYRYFGGLPELLEALGNYSVFWPTVEELTKGVDLQTLPHVERLQVLADRIIDALRSRPLTLEIMAMEIGAPKELREKLSPSLDRWGEDITELICKDYTGDITHLNVVMNVLFAGIKHFLICSRNLDSFGGIPIGKDDGWIQIKQSLQWLSSRLM